MAGLVIVGVMARSLAVLAEGGDFLLDAAGVAVGILAVWLTRRKPGGASDGSRWTDMAALVNAGWLLAVELLVAAGAVKRLATGVPQVHGLPVLVMSGVAGIVMVAAALVLRDGEEHEGGKRRDALVAAVLLDSVADAAAAFGVAVTGAIILATGAVYWLDPTVALVVAVVVSYHAAKLIWKVVRVR